MPVPIEPRSQRKGDCSARPDVSRHLISLNIHRNTARRPNSNALCKKPVQYQRMQFRHNVPPSRNLERQRSGVTDFDKVNLQNMNNEHYLSRENTSNRGKSTSPYIGVTKILILRCKLTFHESCPIRST